MEWPNTPEGARARWAHTRRQLEEQSRLDQHAEEHARMSDQLRGNDNDGSDDYRTVQRDVEQLEQLAGDELTREFRTELLELLRDIRAGLLERFGVGEPVAAVDGVGSSGPVVEAYGSAVPDKVRLARAADSYSNTANPLYLARFDDVRGSVLERGIVIGGHNFSPDHCDVCYADTSADLEWSDVVEHTHAELLASLDRGRSGS